MKTLFKNISLILLLGISLFVANSCDNPLVDKETGDDITLLLVDPDVFDTKILVHLRDTLGNYLDGDSILVAFNGEGASQIINVKGKHVSTYSTTNGIFEVAVDPAFVISESNPLSFTIYAAEANFQWFAFPREVQLVKLGNFDVIIELYELSTEKSATQTTGNRNPADEPFVISANNNYINNYLDKKCEQIGNGLHYYGIYKFPSGTFHIECEKINNADYSITDYGLQFWSAYSESDKGNKIFHSNGTVEINKASGWFYDYAFSGKNEGYKQCANGINTTLEYKNDSGGLLPKDFETNEKFEYTLYAVDAAKTKNKILIGAYGANSGGFSYPEGTVSFVLKSNDDSGNYFIDEKRINVDEICGCNLTVSVTINESSVYLSFKFYDIMVQIKEPGGQLAFSPSFSGQYVVESEVYRSNLKNFAFVKGKCRLVLKPDENYWVYMLYGNKRYEFRFPTNESKKQSVIDRSLQEVNGLEKMTIDYRYPSHEGIVWYYEPITISIYCEYSIDSPFSPN